MRGRSRVRAAHGAVALSWQSPEKHRVARRLLELAGHAGRRAVRAVGRAACAATRGGRLRRRQATVVGAEPLGERARRLLGPFGAQHGGRVGGARCIRFWAQSRLRWIRTHGDQVALVRSARVQNTLEERLKRPETRPREAREEKERKRSFFLAAVKEGNQTPCLPQLARLQTQLERSMLRKQQVEELVGEGAARGAL